ncbi:MAG: DUF6325 family protein [Acidimicrobiia bacterium]
MTDEDVYGPIDFLLMEFPGTTEMTGEVAQAVMDLVDAGIVRIYDVLIIRKAEDGTFEGINIEDLGADEIGGFTAFAGARSGLLGDDDLAEAAGALEPGTVAILFVYENAWAIPFVAAARRQGGQVVASARIPAQTINDVLDAAEAAG